MKSLLIKTKSLLVNATKEVSIKTSRQVFVNPDGTITGDITAYREFKQDVIKSSGYGW